MTPFGFPLDRYHVPEREELPQFGSDPHEKLPLGITDHADAFASVLRRYAKLISEGRSAEDCARELLPIVRIAARYV